MTLTTNPPLCTGCTPPGLRKCHFWPEGFRGLGWLRKRVQKGHFSHFLSVSAPSWGQGRLFLCFRWFMLRMALPNELPPFHTRGEKPGIPLLRPVLKGFLSRFTPGRGPSGRLFAIVRHSTVGTGPGKRTILSESEKRAPLQF